MTQSYEAAMLVAIASSRISRYHTQSRVAVPSLLFHDPTLSLQILEDFHGSYSLKSHLVESASNARLSSGMYLTLGQELGYWLHDFHKWCAAPGQSQLREKFRGNIGMKDLKLVHGCGKLQGAIDNFQDVLLPYTQTFSEVYASVAALPDSDLALIHGDFWPGNVLLRANLPPTGEGDFEVRIVDFEMAQLGRRAWDLAQVIAELYCIYHFHGSNAARQVIKGFVRAYGTIVEGPADVIRVDENDAKEILLHVGVHLVAWTWRTGWEKGEKLQGCLIFGGKCIEAGFKKNHDAIIEAWKSLLGAPEANP